MPEMDEPELQIEVPQDDLFALTDWLGNEETLRGRVRPVRQVPEPGQMGTMVDVLTVALGTGGAGVALVRSLCTWLTQRRADVTVIIKAPDGRRVQVDVRRARDPESLIREVASLIGGGSRDQR